MKRIGILTSGGDNPGLNPCIRAVVRMGIHLGIEIMGIRRGFAGLIDGEIDEMDARSVGGIMAQGGRFWAPLAVPSSTSFADGRRRCARSIASRLTGWS